MKFHGKPNLENPNQSPFYPKTGGFLSAPKTSVLGIIGDRVLLPCQVGSVPIPEDFSIRWTFHGQSQRIPVSSYDGKDRREEPDERYQGRAEFFHRDFRAGNVSLLLRNVQSSDQGSYSCEVSFQDVSREVLVELEVAEIKLPHLPPPPVFCLLIYHCLCDLFINRRDSVAPRFLSGRIPSNPRECPNPSRKPPGAPGAAPLMGSFPFPAVPVALDPEARPLDLGDAQDPLQVPVLVARDALGAGKCYWEVELGRERDWALGVLRDGPSLAGPHSWDSRHSRHCWALRASQGQLFSSGSGSRLLREQSRGLSALGVFLDSEEERLEFYDVEQRDLVAGMSLGAGEDPSGKFFPFVSQGEEGTLRIRSVPMPEGKRWKKGESRKKGRKGKKGYREEKVKKRRKEGKTLRKCRKS
uniref:Uncharacterized protein n=1 Tax=Corvus moneduloides TaxID=1196302 RepID=A0A8U7P858_CORMO